MSEPKLHIGELARRAGVKPSLIRAWEQRYGLLDPARSAGGTRLYSVADLARVQSMIDHLDSGLSASQAAIAALGTSLGRHDLDYPQAIRSPAQVTERSEIGRAAEALVMAFKALDPVRSRDALDYLLVNFRFETVAQAVILPYLQDVGSRWAHGETSIAEEHFATNILRGRLLGLAALGRVVSPPHRAVLACPPEERHDLALVICGVALARQGWQVSILGADTPVETMAEAARAIRAHTVLVTAVFPETLAAVTEALHGLSASVRLYLAGAGASAALADACGAETLRLDPIAAAAHLTLRMS